MKNQFLSSLFLAFAFTLAGSLSAQVSGLGTSGINQKQTAKTSTLSVPSIQAKDAGLQKAKRADGTELKAANSKATTQTSRAATSRATSTRATSRATSSRPTSTRATSSRATSSRATSSRAASNNRSDRSQANRKQLIAAVTLVSQVLIRAAAPPLALVIPEPTPAPVLPVVVQAPQVVVLPAVHGPLAVGDS